MADRPHNIRAASILERSYAQGAHNVRRLAAEMRTEETRNAGLPYRGSHRAGSRHHAEDQTAAQRRNSRVGRHHAESGTEDLSGRWS